MPETATLHITDTTKTEEPVPYEFLTNCVISLPTFLPSGSEKTYWPCYKPVITIYTSTAQSINSA
jgi:hypothetical protein